MLVVRPVTADDRPVIWALNALPNVGATRDDDCPLDLPPAADPPTSFPDLATVPESFTDAGGEFLVVTDGPHLVGMGGLRPTGDGRAEVQRVRVHPARRRLGVGTLLMQSLEAAAAARGLRELHLDTASNQPEAVAFYGALGYERTGTETRPEWSWTLVFFRRVIAGRGAEAGGAGRPAPGPTTLVRGDDMRTIDEPGYGVEVTVPLAIGPVKGTVREIYGPPDDRRVVVLVTPELNPDVVFDTTTYPVRLAEVTWERVAD